MGDPGLALDELVDVPFEAAAMTLRNWLQQRGLPAPDQALIQEFLRQLRGSSPAARPRLQCSAYVLQRYRQAVFLLPPPLEFLPPEPLALQVGESYDIEGVGRVGLEPTDGAGLALGDDELLTLDWRRGGERSRPVGGGGSNSLKKQLQAAGVPPWWRDRVPLLYLADELLAAGGLRSCESSRWRHSGAPGERLWRLWWERDGGAVRD
jgi:tRNA(Ile)-lysidine synthase